MRDAASSPAVLIGAGGKGDPLLLRNPIVAASGTFVAGTELHGAAAAEFLGAVVSPAIGRRSRPGGSGWHIAEAPAGLLLSGDYPMIGYRHVLDRLGRMWAHWPMPVIANVPVDDIDESLETVIALADEAGVAAVELDCTRLGDAITSMQAARALHTLTARHAAAWPRPLLIKLRPVLPGCLTLARAAAEGGAAAISIGGGFPARAGSISGAGAEHPARCVLVGPATMPIALRTVAIVAAALAIPVFGSGGVTTATDATSFLRAGAVAVQVGSASLRSPSVIFDVTEGLTNAGHGSSIAGIDATMEMDIGE